jgi:hypothetical protein
LVVGIQEHALRHQASAHAQRLGPTIAPSWSSSGESNPVAGATSLFVGSRNERHICLPSLSSLFGAASRSPRTLHAERTDLLRLSPLGRAAISLLYVFASMVSARLPVTGAPVLRGRKMKGGPHGLDRGPPLTTSLYAQNSAGFCRWCRVPDLASVLIRSVVKAGPIAFPNAIEEPRRCRPQDMHGLPQLLADPTKLVCHRTAGHHVRDVWFFGWVRIGFRA